MGDPRDNIHGGDRCALRKSDWLDDWYVGTSPRNGDNAIVEGSWEDWVTLACNILDADKAFSAIAMEARQGGDEGSVEDDSAAIAQNGEPS